MDELVKDHLVTLKRDYAKSELARQLCLPNDLLEACNPGQLENPRKGQIISIGGLFRVQPGDTFWTISRQLAKLGAEVTVYDLIKYNASVDPRNIKPESLLIVPKPRKDKRE